MTNNNDLYAELLRQGAPELPKGYYYKFWIGHKEMLYQTIKTTEEKPWSEALYGTLRKKVWGGLFYKTISTRYINKKNLSSSYHVDNAALLHREWITLDEIDGKWHLPHFALLAEENNKERLRQEAKAKRDAEAKANYNPKSEQDYYIKHYLNKRLP